MKDGATRIAEERARQLEKLGWSADHDDGQRDGQLAMAAACYAASAAQKRIYAQQCYAASVSFYDPFPWRGQRYDARPYDGNVLINSTTDDQAIRLLEKAGALIAAEIDRLLRAKAKK